MIKLYQHTIDKSVLIGSFKTEKEAQQTKVALEKKGVGVIRIKKYEKDK